LFQLMTTGSVGEVLQDFFMGASPMVTNAMREAVSGLLGGLPREVDVEYQMTSDKLGNLAGMLMMTGYMFRNAEYVVTLQQLLSIKSRSLTEYKRAFDAIDLDGSGTIEVSEVGALLDDFYPAGEGAPAFEVAAFVRFFDRRGKGYITWRDFKEGFGMADGSKVYESPFEDVLKALPSGDGGDTVMNEGETDRGDMVGLSVGGTISLKLESGEEVEVDAVQYIDELKMEAQALRTALLLAAEEEKMGGRAGGSQAGRSSPQMAPSPGSMPLGEYIAQLEPGQKARLTDNIEPATVEAMRRLVAYMVGETNPEKIDEFSLERGSLASLCLWQLVTGYRLRDAEATGKANELRGL